jgi:predicted lipoprotein with Yx(FWY)xxD motif
MQRFALGLSAAILFTGLTAGIAFAAGADTTYQDSSLGKVLADSKGMTLYTFDNDGKGAMKSSCSGKCAAAWPPFVAPTDASASGDWTVVDGQNKDGTAVKMWAYEGWPLYYWQNDKKPGDVDGDGKGGVWHIVKQD